MKIICKLFILVSNNKNKGQLLQEHYGPVIVQSCIQTSQGYYMVLLIINLRYFQRKLLAIILNIMYYPLFLLVGAI